MYISALKYDEMDVLFLVIINLYNASVHKKENWRRLMFSNFSLSNSEDEIL